MPRYHCLAVAVTGDPTRGLGLHQPFAFPSRAYLLATRAAQRFPVYLDKASVSTASIVHTEDTYILAYFILFCAVMTVSTDHSAKPLILVAHPRSRSSAFERACSPSPF